MVAIFLAKVSRAISGACPWPLKPRRTRERGRPAGSYRGGTLKQVLQIVIAVAVEAPHQDVLPGSLQLSFDTVVIGAAVHLDG